jgi:hypothetical protein
MAPPRYGSNTNPVQTAMILDHLRRTSITPLEALMFYGIMRLASRIYELRSAGYGIVTTMIKDLQTGKRYASYTLISQPHQGPTP